MNERHSELPERRAVLSGVGQSAIGRRLDRSSFQLTIDAIQSAVSDAGLTMDDIDGLATYPGMTARFNPGFVGPDIYNVQDALGLELDWHLGMPQGAAQIAPVMAAVLAVSGGFCRHAVVFRTVAESSAQGAGPRRGLGADLEPVPSPMSWPLAVGGVSASNWAALYATRHMHVYGTTKEQLGWVAINGRRHAAGNPDTIFDAPLSMNDYLTSRPISSPFSLLDCDIPVDGCTAVVVSTVDASVDLRQPVAIEAMGGALRHRPLWEQWEDLTTMGSHDAAAQMWSRTHLEPKDVDVVELYDGFSIFPLMWLEAFGFCEPGGAGPFVEGGERIALGGELPMNTFGGQLSAGRTHGYGFLAEAIRQVRGEAGARQVKGASVVAVGVGGGVVAGALLLAKVA